MTPSAWNGDDPMADTFYCRIPYSPNDVLQNSTAYATNPTDEASIGRYEDVARQYLSGRAPVLITAALRGPFDAASGWVNPWLGSGAAKPTTFTQRLTAASLQRKTRSPAICEPATSPPPEQTQTTESSCHLPSPESLYAEPHPYLENDEVARVEQWRDTVQSNAPTREDFWSSKTQSSTKRPREDSSWLKRRVEKRPRTADPEPKLSSPVSIADKPRGNEAVTSPLATPMTSNGRPIPPPVASQSRNELDTTPKAPTLPRSSQNSKPRSSRRVSQPSSPRLRSTSRSGVMRRSTPLDNSTPLADISSHTKKGRPSKSPRTSPKKTPASHSAVGRRSSLAVEPKDSPLSISSDHSLSETSLGQSHHEGVVKIDQDIFDADEHPTTLIESDQASEAQEPKQHSLPEEDRVMQEIAPNAAPFCGEAGTKNAAHVEDDIALGADLAHRLISNRKSERKGPLGTERDLGRLPPVDIVVEPYHGEGEPTTAASVPVVGNLSDDSSTASSSSPTDLASPTLVEEGEDHNMPETAQLPEHPLTKLIATEVEVHDVPGSAQDPKDQEPSTPSLPEALSCPPLSKMDAATLQAESPDGGSEACPTPHVTSRAEDALPSASISLPSTQKESAVVEVQSPWMKDPVKNVVNHACTEQSPPHLSATEDQETQSFVVPPEAQSPWMDRPASQPQGVKNAFFSPYSSPQLPPAPQNAPEESQAPAQTEHFAVESDVSNTDFSIRSFSSFMSPRTKPRSILPFNDHLPHTPSLLAAATENPWQTADSGRKKRVSWAPLPGEADNDVDSPAPRTPGLGRAASPPPAAPIPDELEGGAQVFKRHFATVKSRTNPIRQRLLPSASQMSQRSPETDAMARAFVAASESPLMSSAARAGVDGSKGVLPGERYADAGEAVGAGGEGGVEEVDDVADVLANLDDFLTSWDDETDLKLSRSAGRDSCGGSATRRSSRFDLEIGGW